VLQESGQSNGTLVTPPRTDTGSSSVPRGRRCDTSGSHLSMMSGGDLFVSSSSVEENSEFVETDVDNVLSGITVSNTQRYFHSVPVSS